MKILIDAHKIGEKYEGTNTHLIGLYRAMMVLKPDWEFVFVGPYLKVMQEAFGSGANRRYITLATTNKFRRLLWDLPKLMLKECPDYTHFQYISPLWRPTPTLVTIHDLLFLEPEFKQYFPWIYRLLNGFLFRLSAQSAKILCTVSAYGKKQLSAHYGTNPDKITITSNAVTAHQMSLDMAKKRVAGYGLDRFILFVSRVEPRKNHKLLWRAFETLDLQQQGFKLVFIGKKEWMDSELENIMAQSDSAMKQGVLWLESCCPICVSFLGRRFWPPATRGRCCGNPSGLRSKYGNGRF
jgi:glycosyltransferase involved in cell wall biosynthesis